MRATYKLKFTGPDNPDLQRVWEHRGPVCVTIEPVERSDSLSKAGRQKEDPDSGESNSRNVLNQLRAYAGSSAGYASVPTKLLVQVVEALKKTEANLSATQIELLETRAKRDDYRAKFEGLRRAIKTNCSLLLLHHLISSREEAKQVHSAIEDVLDRYPKDEPPHEIDAEKGENR